MKKLLLIALLFCQTAHADEIIAGFDKEKDLPVLNQELRDIRKEIDIVSDSITNYTPSASNALSGSVIRVVNIQTGAAANGSGTFTNNDSIPQNTDGNEFMTLAITPSNASNKLRIDIVACVLSSSGGQVIGALFQDSTAGALAAAESAGTGTSTGHVVMSFTHYMTAGTTSPTTFKFRAGAGGGSTYFNGGPGGTANRLMGGVCASSITITEIKA